MGVTWDDEEAVVILAKWRCASLTEAGWSHLSSSMRLLFKEMLQNVGIFQNTKNVGAQSNRFSLTLNYQYTTNLKRL